MRHLPALALMAVLFHAVAARAAEAPKRATGPWDVKALKGLHYAAAVGPWQKREWKSAPAEIKDGRVTANLPGERPLVYFLAVTDSG